MKKSIFFLSFFLSFFLKAQDNTARLANSQRVSSVNSVDFLTISLPLDRSVYQRNSSNKATITIAGQLGIVGFTNWVRYTVERLNKAGVYQGDEGSVISLPVNEIVSKGGLFSVERELPTGWYRIKIQQNYSYRPSGFGNNITTTKYVKVGVGEVIFIAGQSNAQGIDNVRAPDSGPDGEYDCISTVNENGWCRRVYNFPEFQLLRKGMFNTDVKIAPNGNQDVWCYEALAKKLVDKESGKVIPICFFNAASVATSIDNWSVSSGNENAITEPPLFPLNDDGTPTKCCQTNRFDWGPDAKPEGQPYRGLKTSLNYYGSMFGTRGVIWHQGESDSYKLTNTSDYQTKLNTVIAKTRSDFNSNLGWAISRVSRYTTTRSEVITAQENAKTNGINTQWGAYFSDDITDRGDDVHFNAIGLTKMAEMYSSTGAYAGNSNGGNILGLTQVISPTSPAIVPTFNNIRTTVTLGVAGTYSSYCWVKDNAKMNQCIYTTPTTPALPNLESSTNESWRCYVTNASGQTTISQEAVTPLTTVYLSLFGGLINIPRIPPTPKPKITMSSIRTDWMVDNIPSWASLNVTSGTNGSTEITVTVSENTSSSSRSGTMKLKSADGTLIQDIPISQQGTGGGTPSCDNGSNSPFSITSASYDNSTKCVHYQFNASNLSAANWSISNTSNSGALQQPIQYNFGTVNCGVTLPDGTYNFVLTGVSCNGTTSKSFIVSSSGGNSLSLNQSSWSPNSSANSQGVSITSNIAWSVSTSDGSWLTASPTSGSNNGSFTITAIANGSTSSRSGTITVSGSGVNSQTVSVTQAGTGGGSSTCSNISSVTCGNASEGYTHTVNVPQAGDYKFKITYATGESNAMGSIKVDSDPVIQFPVGPSTGSWNPSAEVFVGTVQKTLSAGNHNIRIAGVNGVSGSNFAHNKLCVVSASGGGGGGNPSCSYTNGQFMTEWLGNEVIRAYICGTKFYAKNDAGYFKSKSWLTGTGRFTQAELDCFEEINPGCGGLRIAAVQSEEIPEKITTYPNPTTGKIKIVFSLTKAENVWLNLYDIQGKSLDLRDFEGKAGRNEMEYDLQNYPSGAYFVNFQSSEKREVLKVVKVN
jgi:hypothetical protein